MTGKIILYTIVLTAAAALGFLASYQLAGAPETIARPQALSERAAAAAEAAAASASGAPDFNMPDLAGGERRLSDWHGQPRLVNFWATWCAPCRREIPLLKTLQREQSVAGLQVIGIAFDDMDAVRDYAAEAAFNYPVLVGEAGAMAAAEAFGLDLMALPFTLIVSADGQLINAHVGEIDAEEAAVIIGVLGELESGAITLKQAQEKLAG